MAIRPCNARSRCPRSVPHTACPRADICRCHILLIAPAWHLILHTSFQHKSRAGFRCSGDEPSEFSQAVHALHRHPPLLVQSTGIGQSRCRSRSTGRSAPWWTSPARSSATRFGTSELSSGRCLPSGSSALFCRQRLRLINLSLRVHLYHWLPMNSYDCRMPSQRESRGS